MGAAGSGATDGGLLGARGVCLRVSGVVSCGRVSVRIRADYHFVRSVRGHARPLVPEPACAVHD